MWIDSLKTGSGARPLTMHRSTTGMKKGRHKPDQAVGAPNWTGSETSTYFLAALFSFEACLVVCRLFLSTFLGLLSPMANTPFSKSFSRVADVQLIACHAHTVNIPAA